jgi:hypothetical protein
MSTQFDFSSIADLGSFWDGNKKTTYGGSPGGGQFNTHTGQAGINSNLDNLYQSLIGRNADPGGRDYWSKQIASGATDYAGVADAIKASGEYTDQQDAISGGATADQLKMLDSAYVSPFNQYSGSAVAGWQPGDAITQEIANAVTTDPNVKGSNYSDQTNKNVGDVISSLGIGGGIGGTGSMNYTPYDDSGLRDLISGLTGQLGDLRSAFDSYKKQSADDMQNMWNNANWGWGQTVGGVRTQNELPGWAAKKGGTSGFFGRGGRSGKGLTTASLNI